MLKFFLTVIISISLFSDMNKTKESVNTNLPLYEQWFSWDKDLNQKQKTIILKKINFKNKNHNKENFILLISNSLSLNFSEKQKVINSISTLSDFQVKELIKTYYEENTKFQKLKYEYPKDITLLINKAQEEWYIIIQDIIGKKIKKTTNLVNNTKHKIPEWLKNYTDTNISIKTSFDINKKIQKKHQTLIELIKQTESMDDDERQYWFDIMPSMTDSQINRLLNILNTEKKKLQLLEAKYQNEIKSLNEKHLIEWKEFQLKDYIKKHKIKNSIYKTQSFLKDTNITLYPYVPLLTKAKIGTYTFLTIKELYDNNITYLHDSINDINKQIINRSLSFGNKDRIIDYWIEFQKSDLSFKKFYEDNNETKIYINLLELIGNTAINLKHEPITNSIIKELKNISKNKFYKQELKRINKILTSFELSYYLNKQDYEKYAQLYRNYYKADNMVIFDLLHLTIGSHNSLSNIESQNTIKQVIKYINNDNILQTYLDKKNWRYELEAVFLDIIRFYNKQYINSSLNKQIDSFISNVIENNLTTTSYYRKLNNDFFHNSIDLSMCLNSKNNQTGLNVTFREDGCKIETLTYQAFTLMKSTTNKKANYDKAKELLKIAKQIGVSEYSDANDYIEKDLILFLDNQIDKFYQNELTYITIVKYYINKITKYAYEYTGKFITIVSTFILVILFFIVILFPASKISRINLIHELVFSKVNIILPLFKNLIINKLINYYNKKRFPTVHFLPYELRINKKDFLIKYLPFNYFNNDNEAIDKQITLKLKTEDSVLLWGNGGFGKTLTAYKVTCCINDYLPIWINAKQLEHIDTNNILQVYSNDNYIISMLNKFNYNKYLFILDDIGKDFNLNLFLDNIKANYSNSKVIITSRSFFYNVPNFEFSKEKINFEKYLLNIDNTRINYLRTFIDKIENPLLISIILNATIDISAINIYDKSKIEKEILSSYIAKQLSILCKINGFSKIPNTDCIYFMKYILKKIAIIDDRSMKNILTIFTELDDELLRVALAGLEKSLHNKLNIIDHLSKTSLIYKKDNSILFAHDLIAEYLLELPNS